MLALQIPEFETLRLIQTEKPKPGPRELLLRVVAGGICGTDPHILHGVYPANLPIIPGHEYSGVVESVGAEVEGFGPGDHVSVDPNIVCGYCSFCRRGRAHLCKNLVALGVNIPGGFAEFNVVPVAQAYKLPKDYSLEQSALAEPVACCLRGMDLSNMQSGDRVVIFGAGPMGAIMLQLARLYGASEVIMVEPQSGRIRRAEKLGAAWVIDPAKDDPVKAIRDRHPDGVEVVFDCSGSVHAIRQTLRLVARGGTVMMYGVCAKENNVDLNPFWVNDNEITIRGSYNNPYTHSRALDLMVSGRLDAGAVVTTSFPLKDSHEAFKATGSSEVLKVVIAP
ncbi:MAG: zinc-dependent alcohol dehydrogenase family protein [Bryobacteraceae bacterium]